MSGNTQHRNTHRERAPQLDAQYLGHEGIVRALTQQGHQILQREQQVGEHLHLQRDGLLALHLPTQGRKLLDEAVRVCVIEGCVVSGSAGGQPFSLFVCALAAS